MSIIIQCDRCKGQVEGMESEDATGGFYRTEAGYWKAMAGASDSEKVICDSCMWKSPTYISTYGNTPNNGDNQDKEDK